MPAFPRRGLAPTSWPGPVHFHKPRNVAWLVCFGGHAMFPAPEPARTEEFGPAFRLLFSHLPPDERDKRVSNTLLLLQRGELNPEGVFVLRGAEGVQGALVCLPMVGATALIWPPRCVEDAFTRDNEDRLVRRATEWLQGQGVKLAQSLLSVEENELGPSLERNGFQDTTPLCFYRHRLEPAPAPLEPPGRTANPNYER